MSGATDSAQRLAELTPKMNALNNATNYAVGSMSKLASISFDALTQSASRLFGVMKSVGEQAVQVSMKVEVQAATLKKYYENQLYNQYKAQNFSDDDARDLSGALASGKAQKHFQQVEAIRANSLLEEEDIFKSLLMAEQLKSLQSEADINKMVDIASGRQTEMKNVVAMFQQLENGDYFRGFQNAVDLGVDKDDLKKIYNFEFSGPGEMNFDGIKGADNLTDQEKSARASQAVMELLAKNNIGMAEQQSKSMLGTWGTIQLRLEQIYRRSMGLDESGTPKKGSIFDDLLKVSSAVESALKNVSNLQALTDPNLNIWEKLGAIMMSLKDQFSNWWYSGGSETVEQIANDMGKALGTGITAIFSSDISADKNVFVSLGLTIVKGLLKGFVEGFDLGAIMDSTFGKIALLLGGGWLIKKMFTPKGDLLSGLISGAKGKLIDGALSKIFKDTNHPKEISGKIDTVTSHLATIVGHLQKIVECVCRHCDCKQAMSGELSGDSNSNRRNRRNRTRNPVGNLRRRVESDDRRIARNNRRVNLDETVRRTAGRDSATSRANARFNAGGTSGTNAGGNVRNQTGGTPSLQRWGNTGAPPSLQSWGNTGAPPSLQRWGNTGAPPSVQRWGNSGSTQSIQSLSNPSAAPSIQRWNMGAPQTSPSTWGNATTNAMSGAMASPRANPGTNAGGTATNQALANARATTGIQAGGNAPTSGLTSPVTPAGTNAGGTATTSAMANARAATRTNAVPGVTSQASPHAGPRVDIPEGGKSSLLKSFAKKGIRRIPGVSTALSVFDIFKAKDKAGATIKAAGSGLGGWGGAAAGAALGTAIFPGVGTVVGGLIGGIAGAMTGEKVGEITSKKLDTEGFTARRSASRLSPSRVTPSSGTGSMARDYRSSLNSMESYSSGFQTSLTNGMGTTFSGLPVVANQGMLGLQSTVGGGFNRMMAQSNTQLSGMSGMFGTNFNTASNTAVASVAPLPGKIGGMLNTIPGLVNTSGMSSIGVGIVGSISAGMLTALSGLPPIAQLLLGNAANGLQQSSSKAPVHSSDEQEVMNRRKYYAYQYHGGGLVENEGWAILKRKEMVLDENLSSFIRTSAATSTGQGVSGNSSGPVNIQIGALANTLQVREEADIHNIAAALSNELKRVLTNQGVYSQAEVAR
ncbi:hypothetical protein EV586_102426 [Tumebacillus sp. BK434]|uniref:glycine zipper domain-containing protein n=1 Tax=Tumebacillus sp. BK434 TaxID=2512169 RepID=UPI0010453356|nr:glycine zipper domain-containing protein [Tumebacillus sp. BK434]TCP57978.1 hypothetical protein EV586_102426 [Tumebacillus sp. BK434]